MNSLQKEINKRDAQARSALSAGREDLARAGAIDELLASGALEDHVGGGTDSIQAELDKIGAGAGVEDELARMKGEIAASAPKQIEGNGAAGAGQEAATAEQQAGDGS